MEGGFHQPIGTGFKRVRHPNISGLDIQVLTAC